MPESLQFNMRAFLSLNCAPPGVPAEERINHKRVYRVMRDHGLLLSKYAEKPQRTHEGKVMTLKATCAGARISLRFAVGTVTVYLFPLV